MRKVLVVLLIGALAVSLLPSTALAGGPHAVRNRWTGFAIGATVATLGGILLSPLWAPPPVVAAPPVVYTRPPLVYAPPPVVDYRTWVPGHYENRWVPAADRQRVWVEGHYEKGWWVPGHWQEQVRNSGYWARVWVEGSYR